MRPLVKYLLTVGLLALQVVALTAILLTTRANNEAAFLGSVDELTGSIADTTVAQVQDFIRPAETAATLTARAVERTRGLDDPALANFLHDQLAVTPQLAGIFIGTESGDFLFVSRDETEAPDGFRIKQITADALGTLTELVYTDASFSELTRMIDPDDAYDPRVRPWYQMASAADALIWTDPYVFFTSRQPGVTTALPVALGDTHAVVGVDIEVAELSTFMADITLGKDTSAFVMDVEGDLIAYPDLNQISRPDGDGVRLTRVEELDDPVVRAAYGNYVAAGASAQVGALHFVAADSAHFGTFRTVDLGVPWIVGVHAPESEFLADFRANERRTLVTSLIIGLIAAVLAIPIAFGYFRPLGRLHRQATTDSLTGLPNRRQLLHRGRNAVTAALAGGTPLAAILLDVDNFKVINDTMGHQVGDEVLRALSGRLASTVRQPTAIGRYGGEEFLAIVPHADLARGVEVAERLRRIISDDPVRTEAGPVPVTASFGVAQLSGDDLDDLIAAADIALLEAKDSGKNTVRVAVLDDGQVSTG